MCEVLSQSATISPGDARTITIPSNDNYFMFTNLNSDTMYKVTITLRYKNRLTSATYTVKTSAPCGKFIAIRGSKCTILSCMHQAIVVTWMQRICLICMSSSRYTYTYISSKSIQVPMLQLLCNTSVTG